MEEDFNKPTQRLFPQWLFFGAIVILLAPLFIYGLVNTYKYYSAISEPTPNIVTETDDVHEQELRAQIESVIADAPPEVQAALREEIENTIATLRTQPAPHFEYQLVLDAPNRIDIAPPPDSADSDQAAYYAILTDEEKTDVASSTRRYVIAYDTDDTVHNLPFKNTDWADYIYQESTPEEEKAILQVYDELGDLTYYFNEQYNRPPLVDRIEAVFPTTYDDIETREKFFIYPSFKVVEGLATAEMMARMDPQNAQFYHDEVEAFIERGMVYGIYGESDIEAARSLVEQYFALLDASDNIPSVLLSAKP